MGIKNSDFQKNFRGLSLALTVLFLLSMTVSTFAGSYFLSPSFGLGDTDNRATYAYFADGCDEVSFTSIEQAKELVSGVEQTNMCGAGQYYKITTTEECEITWTMTPSDATTDFDMYGFVNDSNVLDYACAPFSDVGVEETCSEVMPAGTYYAFNEWYTGDGSYSIKVDVVCDSIPQECDSESFLTAETAKDLVSGEAQANMCGEKQFYEVTTTDVCDVTFTMIPSDATTDYDLYAFLGDDGVTYDCGPYLDAGLNEVCVMEGLPAGTYSAYTEWYEGNGTYSIQSDVVCDSIPQECDSESFLTVETAKDLVSGEAQTNMCGTERQYYSITTDQTCNVTLTMSPSDATTDYDLYAFLGDDGVTYDCAPYLDAGLNEVCVMEALPAGTYSAYTEWYEGNGTYSIQSDVVCDSIPQVCDSNSFSSIDAAGELESGFEQSNMCGADQFYSVTTTDVCDVSWTMTPSDSNTDYDMSAFLIDENNLTFECSLELDAGVTEVCAMEALPAGTYFARNIWYTGEGTYSIQVDLNNCPQGIPRPTVVTTSINMGDITDEDVDSNFVLQVAYSEDMNTQINPTITFITEEAESANTLYDCLGNWTDVNVFDYICNIQDLNVVDSVDLEIADAQSAISGKLQVEFSTLDYFTIHTGEDSNVPQVIVEKFDLNLIDGNIIIVSAMDGNVEIDINASASMPITLAVGTLNSWPQNGSWLDLGKCIDIDAPDLNGNMHFALIKLHYSDAELTAKGIDESTLRLYSYNSDTNSWVISDAPNGGVDTVNNYVWATTEHFSVWAAFGSAPAAPPVNTGGGGGSSRRPTTGAAPTPVEEVPVTSEVPSSNDTTPQVTTPTSPVVDSEVSGSENLTESSVTATDATDSPSAATGFFGLGNVGTYGIVILVIVAIFIIAGLILVSAKKVDEEQ